MTPIITRLGEAWGLGRAHQNESPPRGNVRSSPVILGDDTLPPSIPEEPLVKGPAAGQVVELDDMLPLFD